MRHFIFLAIILMAFCLGSLAAQTVVLIIPKIILFSGKLFSPENVCKYAWQPEACVGR